MRKVLIAAALLSAGAMTAPASAQYREDYGYGRGENIGWQIDQTQQRIERAYQRGRISERGRHRLHDEARYIERLHYRWMRGGLSRGEERELRDRIQSLRYNLREDRQDGRWRDRGRWDRDWDDDDRWDRDRDDDWDDDDDD